MKTMDFTSSPSLYAIVGSKNDMADQTIVRLDQLEAMPRATANQDRHLERSLRKRGVAG